jgi:prevent-host-death family protein
MKSVGIFEAKTKFTSICDKVARTGQAVVVSKRGQPLVQVAPLPSKMQSERPGILTAWREWASGHGSEESEFPEVWRLRGRSKANPLAK